MNLGPRNEIVHCLAIFLDMEFQLWEVEDKIISVEWSHMVLCRLVDALLHRQTTPAMYTSKIESNR